MPLSDAQPIGPFKFGQDAKWDATPEVAGTIDLTQVKCDLMSWDGTRVIKTLTVGGGITVNGTTSVSLKFATDELDTDSLPKFPPGGYQYEIWTLTAGDRQPVTNGPFTIETRSFG